MKAKKVLKVSLATLFIGSAVMFSSGCEETVSSISSIISSITTNNTSEVVTTSSNDTSNTSQNTETSLPESNDEMK